MTPTRGLLDDFEVSFVALPLIDTDFSRLFTHSYSSYMAICRWHFLFNSELRQAALKKRWVPVSTRETIDYKKSVKAFDRVQVRTKLICWDDRRFYLEQTFLVRGNIHARCFLEGLVRGPDGILEPLMVFQTVGLKQSSPPMPPHIKKWISSQV